MRSHFLSSLNFIFLVLIISACQAKAPVNNDEVCAIDATTGEYDPSCAPNIQNEVAGPGNNLAEKDSYPVEAFYFPIANDAYPISEDDLTLLLTGWRLEHYAENEVELEPPLKVLSFYEDGTYTIATETLLESGTWSTVLLASESTLILASESADVVVYQIIDLGEEVLNLRMMRGDIQIDEGYQLDDESCGCE